MDEKLKIYGFDYKHEEKEYTFLVASKSREKALSLVKSIKDSINLIDGID